MKKGNTSICYIHANDNYMYELTIRKCYTGSNKWKSLIEKYTVVNEKYKLNFNVIHVHADGYYIYTWGRVYQKKRKYGYYYASSAEDVIAIIINICDKYADVKPIIQKEFLNRLENMIELKNYYLAMELLKIDYENFE